MIAWSLFNNYSRNGKFIYEDLFTKDIGKYMIGVTISHILSDVVIRNS